MGEDPRQVYVTGCPSIDLAATVKSRPELDFDPFDKYGGVGKDVDLSDGYLVVMQHPVTTEYQKAREHVSETLHAIAEQSLPALWFWPNVDAGSDGTSKGIRAFRETQSPEDIHFFKNMAPMDFLRILINSNGIVGNSSVAIRECAYLGVPAVNVGSRQEGRDRGRNVIDVECDRRQIANAIEFHLQNGHCEPDPIYGDGNAGTQVANVLAEVTLTFEKRLMLNETGLAPETAPNPSAPQL